MMRRLLLPTDFPFRQFYYAAPCFFLVPRAYSVRYVGVVLLSENPYSYYYHYYYERSDLQLKGAEITVSCNATLLIKEVENEIELCKVKNILFLDQSESEFDSLPLRTHLPQWNTSNIEVHLPITLLSLEVEIKASKAQGMT